MKTNKTSVVLLFLTLVLCLGVMATGVFAIQAVTLNVTGTLGYTMHDAVIAIEGTIYNVAVYDGSEYQKVNKTISRVVMGSDTSTITNSLDLGDLNFWANSPMVFSFTFNNVVNENVIARFSISGLNSQVRVVSSGEYDDLPAIRNLTPKGSNTLIFALELTDTSVAVSDFSFTLTANFETGTAIKDVIVKTFTNEEKTSIWDDTVGKFIELYSEYGTEDFSSSSLCYAQSFPHYIELGKDSDGNKMKWLVVGYASTQSDVNSGNSTFVGEMLKLTANDKTYLSAGVMLANKNYYLLSEKVLEKGLDNTTFINDDIALDEQHPNEVNASDYYMSDIRNCIKTNLTQGYIFTNRELNLIQARTINSLYADIESLHAWRSFGDFHPNTHGIRYNDFTTISDNEKDKFWLLSQSEMFTLFDVDKNNVGTNYSIGLALSDTTFNGYFPGYCSRSPWGKSAVCCFAAGEWDVAGCYVDFADGASACGGARVACQI